MARATRNNIAKRRPRRQASKFAAQPVYSLHEAALTLLDGAIETLKSYPDDEAIHAARKACKRVRAALRLLRGCLGTAEYRRENRRIRDASKPLTAIRDTFMLRHTLRSLPARSVVLQRVLASEYRRERHAIERRGARRAVEQLMRTREQLVEMPLADSEAASAVSGVKRIYKAGRKARLKARFREDLALHEWRKQAKYLLNQLELLEAVFNVKFKKLRRHADQLAETLGRDHDLGVLVKRLRHYRVNEPALMKDIDKRRGKLQVRAFRLGEHVYRRSATDLAATVRARVVRQVVLTGKRSVARSRKRAIAA
jgi:CHAD domain-containing protein